MLKNYLTVVLRQIAKNKTFSFINILGLSFGMAICVVIFQYVAFHTSFDTFNTNADRLFRLESETISKDNAVNYSIKHAPLLTATLAEKSPRVADYARIIDFDYLNSSVEFRDDDKLSTFKQEGIKGIDKSFFSMFSTSFIAGGVDKFDEPYKAVLSLKASKKFFDNPETAIGQVFTLKGNAGNQDYELVGVMEDMPANSHLDFQVALSFPSVPKYLGTIDTWDNPAYRGYVLLNDGADQQEVAQLTTSIFNENFSEQLKVSGDQVDFTLQNIQDIHLESQLGDDSGASVNANMIWILSLIAVVILAVAWINYLNLSLVKTLDRMKEMGVRKCLGSSKNQLVQLFLMESFVLNILSLGLTIVLVNLSSGYLSQTTALPLINILDPIVLGVLLGIALLGTLFTGLYPIVLLKSFNLASVLVGKKGKSIGNRSRKGLVLVQFAVTFLLIASTLTIFKQVDFMRNADLGINTENVLLVEAPPSDINADNRQERAKFRAMTNELLKYPGIESMSMSGEVPGQPISWGASLYLNNQPKESAISTGLIAMDYSFPEFFGIDVVAGRALRQGDDPWSKGDVVINEKLAEQLGFSNPEDAIGANISGFFAPLQVRGVLENHHHTSLHNDYRPIAYIVSGWTRYYFFKLRIDENSDESKTGQLSQMITKMQSEWDDVYPNYQMVYSFVDQGFDKQYKEDVRFGKIFTGFSIVTIVVACLGLFGLTALTVNQKVKEVGIRKVLGASGLSLVRLLSKEYALLVTISGLLSLPLAYFLMTNWLNSYTFRIDIGLWFFLIPFAMIICLAVISVVGKILSVVRANPVEALRYE
ncbi:ABC transporter permease [Roseivirga misakiensis]|uniref:ABC transporter permease n=1 Tax=Roseivirga misakiensis TaxID=1563681 RepID=A0A1E5T176_9BACT|nr:ABC transporter permease [Roseivirga misakiensis]OEK05116.1 hypothetical protein BFP71_17005 [Roseivirga misakiensis]